jgi:hypothetical protein
MKRQIRWREMYESLGITRTTNLSHCEQYPKEAINKHYELYQRLALVSRIVRNDRNGVKGECEQYIEGTTVVSLVMCTESCAIGVTFVGGNYCVVLLMEG